MTSVPIVSWGLIICWLTLFSAPHVAAVSKADLQEMCAKLNSKLRIGMVTRGNTELVLERWRPTFETYLSNELADYGCRTELLPLQFDTYENMTRDQEIEFIFPNPTAFQELADKYGLSPVLSVKRNFGSEQELDRFGGVIVRAAGQFDDIVDIEDIAKYPEQLTVCAVNPNAFGGWHIQWYEMLKVGINVDEHFKDIQFLGNHDKPMLGVVDGTCDIGIARTETIERMEADGDIPVDSLFTIGNRRDELSFPQHISTPLYPEWPLAALSHVPRDLQLLVVIPLLTLQKTSPEAIQGNHAGFTFPYSYQPVRDMFLALDHYGDGRCDPGYAREVEFPAQCYACPAGQFSVEGDACTPCPTGTGNNATASIDCTFCPEGTTTLVPGSTLEQCVTPPKDSFNTPGNWVTIGLATAAVVVFVGVMAHLKRTGETLIATLEKLAQSVAPNIVALTVEISDLASDIAVAIAVVVLDLDGLSTGIRVTYVASVTVLMVPSLYSLGTRAKVIKTELSRYRRSGRARVASTSSARSADVVDESKLSQQGLTGDPAGELLLAELEHARGLAHDAQRINRISLVTLFGLLFEDMLMSVVNCTVLWIARGYREWREHELYGILAVACISSLVNTGFKIGKLSVWASGGRKQGRDHVRRLQRLEVSLPSLTEVLRAGPQAAAAVLRAVRTHHREDSDRKLDAIVDAEVVAVSRSPSPGSPSAQYLVHGSSEDLEGGEHVNPTAAAVSPTGGAVV